MLVEALHWEDCQFRKFYLNRPDQQRNLDRNSMIAYRRKQALLKKISQFDPNRQIS